MVNDPATPIAPMPPNTTAGTVPSSEAIMPARNSPTSFEAPTKPVTPGVPFTTVQESSLRSIWTST